MNFQPHPNVLQGRQAVVQVVGLENETDPPSHHHQSWKVCASQFFAQHSNTPLLHAPQTAHQSQHGRFSAARGAYQDDDFATPDGQVNVVEHTDGRRTMTKGMAQLIGLDRKRS